MSSHEFDIVLNRLDGFTRYLYFHVLGEPLCHPEVKDFVKRAADRGFRVTITTNGTLLDSTLLDSGIYKVNISLHSFEDSDTEEHGKYLERVIRFSREAAKRGVLVSLRLWNLSSGVDNLTTESVLKRAFPDPWQSGREGFTLCKNIYLSYAERFEWPDISNEEKNESLFCYGLRDQIAVLSDGTVVPCCLDAEGDIPLGNIFDESLEKIIASERATKIYDGFSKRMPTEALCRGCSYAVRFNK